MSSLVAEAEVTAMVIRTTGLATSREIGIGYTYGRPKHCLTISKLA